MAFNVWFLIFGACFIINIVCAAQVGGLKKWTRAFRWMNDDAENGRYAIGFLLVPDLSGLPRKIVDRWQKIREIGREARRYKGYYSPGDV